MSGASDLDAERLIVIGLAVSSEFAARLRPIFRREFLGNPEYARLAGWCVAHFEQYGRAPGPEHLGNLFFEKLKTEAVPKDEAEFMQDVLKNLSDRYGDGNDRYGGAPASFDVDFALDRAAQHFRQCALEQHADHLQDLIERGRIDEAEAAARGYKTVLVNGVDSLAAIDMRTVSWLWPGRFALGKFSLVVGNPDQGKSTLLCDLAARVSSGGRWPDGERCRKRAVLIACAEDDFDDTVVPRLVAAGADLAFCFEIGREAADIGALCREIDHRATALRDKGVVVSTALVDPLSSFLGAKVDAHNEAAVRVALRPLKEVLSKHRIAGIALRHLRKAGSGPAQDQISGSLAFVAAARAVYLIAADRDDEGKRIFVHVKNNLARPAPGLAFRIVGAEVKVRTSHGAADTTEVARIEWLADAVTTTAEEAIGGGEAKAKQPKLDEAAEWLREILAYGPMSSAKVETAARAAGYSIWTVRKAAKAAGVRIAKGGYRGGWTWSMPQAE